MKKRPTKKVVQTEMGPEEYRAFAEVAKTQGLTIKEALRQAVLLLASHERDVTDARLTNERLRKKAPKGWDSARVIRDWRSRRMASQDRRKSTRWQASDPRK